MAKFYPMRFGSGDPRQYTGMAPTFLIFKDSAGTNVTAPSIAEVGTSTGIFGFTWGTTTSISFLADAATTSPGTVGRYVSGSIDPADRIDEVGTTLVAIGTTHVAQGTTNAALGTTAVSYGLLNFGLGTTGVALGTTSVALGVTAVALGTTNIALGTTAVALGVTSVALGNTNMALINTIGPLATGIGSTLSSFGDTLTDPGTLFGYLKRIQETLEGNENYIKSTGILSIYSRGSSTLLRQKTLTNSVSTVIKS